MALTTCPDCGNEISDQAPACPNCGRPQAAVQTIEQTGKGWKAAMIIGGALLCAGLLGWAANCGEVNAQNAVSQWCVLLGFLLYLIARLGAFWYHG